MDFVKKQKQRVANALAAEHVTKKKFFTAAFLVLWLYIGSVMMFFGMNFWLWSFPTGLKRSYASIIVPSVLWAAMFIVTTLGCAMAHLFRFGRFDNYFFWWNKKGVVLLVLIGLFDSLTGLTGMYAAVHVPQILQSALISTGPIWTFLLAFVLYPSSQPRFHPILIGVVILIGGGVTLALLPQVLDKSTTIQYFHPAWTVIYLAATALFPLYNVLQGRFLNDFKAHCSPFTRKMVMLSCETTVQLFLTIGYFPVDFSPFYGKCSSAQESWDNLVDSLRCIFNCRMNGVYMVIYVLGFWIRHIVFAYLNTYSPSVAAVTSMLTQPINAFFLLAIPSWNVYGSKKDWRFTLGCFLCLTLAMGLFIVWHLVYKKRKLEVSREDTDTAVAMERNGKDLDAIGFSDIPDKVGEEGVLAVREGESAPAAAKYEETPTVGLRN